MICTFSFTQTTGYKELYLEALSRISELELDGRSLQNLTQSVRDVKIIMVSSCNGDISCSQICKVSWQSFFWGGGLFWIL